MTRESSRSGLRLRKPGQPALQVATPAKRAPHSQGPGALCGARGLSSRRTPLCNHSNPHRVLENPRSLELHPLNLQGLRPTCPLYYVRGTNRPLLRDPSSAQRGASA